MLHLEQVKGVHLAFLGTLGLRDKAAVTGAAAGLLDSIYQVRKEVVLDAGDGHGDIARTRAAHLAGGLQGHVAQLVHGGQNRVALLLRDVRLVVDHAGDGGDGQARKLCDV